MNIPFIPVSTEERESDSQAKKKWMATVLGERMKRLFELQKKIKLLIYFMLVRFSSGVSGLAYKLECLSTASAEHLHPCSLSSMPISPWEAKPCTMTGPSLPIISA